MAQDGTEIDIGGPFFISYRHSDGWDLVTRLAWLLRTAGVPVWRDAHDLPPGDTEDRLREALQAGLAGAVLVVTPDVAKSLVVRNTEVPELLRLERDPAFFLYVANGITVDDGSDGKTDYAAPDRLLELSPGTLSRLDHASARTEDDLIPIVEAVAAARIDRLHDTFDGRLTLDIQTRSAPRSTDRESDIPVRVEPATSGRLPSVQGLKDLAATLSFLPHTVGRADVSEVKISGRAHLTVAFAIGCALPTTFMSNVWVLANDGQEWRGGRVADSGSSNKLTQVTSHTAQITSAADKAVLAYIDLVPGRSDSAYTRLLQESPDRFEEALHIELRDRVIIDPAQSEALTSELAGQIKALSRRHDNAHVHLALYSPFPIAVLLGRLLNTIRISAYEWDDTGTEIDPGPRYVPTLALTPTSGTALITSIATY